MRKLLLPRSPLARSIPLVAGLLLLSGGAAPALAGPSAQTSRIPLAFEPNRGQAAAGFEFLARGEGYLALVNRDGITLRLTSGHCGETQRTGPQSHDPQARGSEAPCATETATLEIEGRAAHARVVPEQRLEGISNYLIGNDSSRWLTHIPQYGALRIEGVYPGIDLVMRPNGSNLRYDFEVAPGADPGAIRLKLAGAEKTEAAGDLLIHRFKGGQLEQRDLRVSQGTKDIPGAKFVATPDGRIGFDVPAWNRREKLVIDPTFSWGTYLGGYGPEDVRGLAIDSAGNAYVTGLANNPVFPTTAGAFDTVHGGGFDAFVTKLNAAGTALVYSTFLGGADNDYGIDIAVDASGSTYVTGETFGPGFPVTAGAFDTTHGGDFDVFVAKLNATGTGLVYSTLLGDSGRDSGFSIDLDGSGNAYLTGETTSAGFPTTAGAFDTTYNSSADAFVTKVNATGTGLVYSTFLGGADNDSARGIDVDAAGNAYVTGATFSATFPVVAGGFDTLHAGDYDVFVTKLNAAGTSLSYSTFLGDAGGDYSRAIAVDTSGNAYVTGYTGSAGYPTTAGAFDTVQSGDYDAFVTKLNPAGTALGYSTFLGDTGPDHAYALAVDSAGRAHVTGYTASLGFPVTAGSLDTVHNGDFDVFVTKLDAAGVALAFSTFLGGAGYEGGYAIAVDTSGNVFVTGQTRSDTFPVTGGAYQTTISGNLDVFVSKINATGDAFSYSTFLGGPGSSSDSSFARAIAVDGSGNAYVTGSTGSAGFPVTAGAYDTAYGQGVDAFVTKLNPAGTGVVYSTYLGGTDRDEANGIAVDASGNAYVAGSTESAGFPTTAGALDTTHNGNWDAFVTKLNPSGSGLVFSTFLGGAGQDQSRGIAVDASLGVYVTGETWSASFPVTLGAYDTSHNGGGNDVFVSKIAPTGDFFTYSTFLGSTAQDDAGGIAVDAAGSAYVTGFTFASGFPTTAGAYDTSYGGGGDAFVTKLNATGSGLYYSTYLGAGTLDYGKAVAVDALFNVYVTGWTAGLGFPTTAGAYDTSHNGGYDVFVTKLNAAGSALLYSTLAGGSSDDMGRGIALDGTGNAHVTGSTNSTGFPVTAGALDTGYNGGGDAFFAQLNAAGAGLPYSTFLGGASNDAAHAIALDAGGSVWLAGETVSHDFPATPGAFQSSQPTAMISGFVTRFMGEDATTTTITADLPDPSVAGEAVPIAVSVVGNTTQPADGQVVITATSGESCSDTTASAGAGTTALFACSITFATTGSRNLSAVYSGSSTHAGSTSAAEPHSVAPLPTLSIDDVSVFEGNGGSTALQFTITRSHTLNTVSLQVDTANGSATAGSDYGAISAQTIVLPAGGAASATLTVNATGDTVVEADETFFVNLSNVVGATLGDGQGQGTIRNDDAASIAIDSVALDEGNVGNTAFVFTVSLSGAVQGGFAVPLSSADGTATAGSDYTAIPPGSLTFAGTPNETQTVAVQVSGETLFEYDETFTVTLGAPSHPDVSVTTATGTGTIRNDDAAPTISIASPSQDEGNGGNAPMNFVVSLSTAAGRPVQFTRATADGTANLANNDYLQLAAGPATIPAGDTTLSIPVQVVGDSVYEGDENFSLALTAVDGATPNSLSGIGTIVDDDQQPTTTTITGRTPSATVVGQAYTVAVRTSGVHDSPLGMVTISDGSSVCGPVALTAGVAPDSTASCLLTSTTAGNKTLTANYAPASAAFAQSTGTASHPVAAAATTIGVTGPARSRVNQPTSFAFALNVAAPGAGTPSGTVTLSSGAASCTATLPATSCSLSFATLGSRTVTASYAGDGNFAASTSSGAGNAQTLVYALADVSVTKTDGAATYMPGDLIVYTLQVRNAGPDTAAQVRVQDIVPAGLSAVTWTCDASGGAACNPASGTGALDAMLATLPPGTLLNYTFYGTVVGAPGQIVNTVTLTLPADTTVEDPNPGNNSASDLSVLDSLFANGFETPVVRGPEGSVRLPTALLASALDEVARVVFRLDDKRGEMARVYARLHLGAVEYALATRGGDGRWTLGPWTGYAVEPTLSWNAVQVADAWQLTRVALR